MFNLRVQCYQEIEKLRGRPLLVYASSFEAPIGTPNSIDLSDVDGFTDLISSYNEKNKMRLMYFYIAKVGDQMLPNE